MRYYISILTPLMMLVCFGGCSSLGSFSNPFSLGVKSEPVQAVAVWSPAARVVNGVPERGFGGRVTFYNNRDKKAIKIDGDIVVYAFEEYPDRSVSDTKPDKVYPFLAEDVKKMHSHSKGVGHSYSLWVPWDTEGADGERKTISLIVKLVTKNARNPIKSGQATCQLPGKDPIPLFADGKTSKETGDIALLGSRNLRAELNKDNYQIRIDGNENENLPTRMATTTIQLHGKNSGMVLQPQSGTMLAADSQEMRRAEQMISQYEQTTYNSQSYERPLPPPQPPQRQPIYPPPVDPRLYEIGPQPTDMVPQQNPYLRERTETSGNATVTYSNVPRF